MEFVRRVVVKDVRREVDEESIGLGCMYVIV